MTNLFVITGVCQPGEQPNLNLARFFHTPETQVLLWLEFKRIEDYSLVSEAVKLTCPWAKLRCAPTAIWGSSSIMTSMLAAINVCLTEIDRWDRLVFCSIRDAPLASHEDILSSLDRNWNFDYCGSRWNRETWDILRPVSDIPVTEKWQPMESYREYHLRSDMTLRVDNALASIYAPDAVTSMRMCNDLYERYISSAWEYAPASLLTIQRLSRSQATERYDFFSRFGLFAGRNWCVLSRRFCNTMLNPISCELAAMFSDILLADECFFQSVAQFFLSSGKISVKWENLYYQDAQSLYIDLPWIESLMRRPKQPKLFARKIADTVTLADLNRVLN